MCRIAGIIDLSHRVNLETTITVMRDSMEKGGPDDAGMLIDGESRLAFGHRRLALLDLSELGHQPMKGFKDGTWLIFNGEIYNFPEIKDELVSNGYSFKTTSDTEVILAAYDAWGTDCFERFNGMFALAIYDKAKHQVILARDHAGIKPLYYYRSNDQVIFASEIRAFKAFNPNWDEDDRWKIAFLTFGHLPYPITTLKNVQPLQKGCMLIINLASLDIEERCFNTFSFSNTIADEGKAVKLVRETLDNAVKRHLISDAPIGLFLSGGVDSSLLTLIASKYIGNNLKTLSIVFEDASLNEAPYQKLIADKAHAHHHSFLVTEKEFEEELPDVLEAMDQPSLDGINSYFVCKYAKKYGLTAVLSGLGADELFGGYPSFNRSAKVAQLQKFPATMLGLAAHVPHQKLKKIEFLKRTDIVGDYLFNRGIFTPSEVALLLQISEQQVTEVIDAVFIDPLPSNADSRNKVSWTETNLYMQNQLLKDSDFMSMWHSVEVRVPFLDKELMQLAFSIAPEVKYNQKIGKHLLIKAFDDVLPKEIWLRKKQGFTFPFYKWMKYVHLASQNNMYLKVKKQYLNNKLHWSKYWTYLLSHSTQDISYSERRQKKILFLNLFSFSITGGIEKFNRAFLRSLTEFEVEGTVLANSISLHDNDIDEKYFSAKKYRGFNGDKLSFVWQVLKAAAQYDTIIVGHLNLALPAMAIKKLYPSKKIILIIHGLEVWEPVVGAKKQLLEKSDVILAVSSYTKSKLINMQGVQEKKIQIFHNTIDPYFNVPSTFKKPEYLKKRYNIYNGDKIIYTMTRMSSAEKYKGYDKVLEALPILMKKYPHFKYIIGGKADEKEKLRVQQIIEHNNLQQHVILSGFIKDEEVQDHFQLADVFIMPSSGEGFGIVFIEAMACGLPVIGGNLDGSVDALQGGRLGKLIDPNDVTVIQNTLAERLSDTEEIISGEELQKAVLKKFGFKEFKNQLEKILVSQTI